MKTSNKLLIAFAAALIIIPILSSVYISKAYYIDGQSWSDLEKQNDSFDGKSENMDAISLNRFDAINIADGKETTFYIRLVKDSKFGIKVNKSDKDFVKFSVDKDGKLQIELTEKTKERRYINLLIYTPAVNTLSANNVSTIELNAKGDSLSVYLKKFNQLRFERSTQFQKLSINAEDGNFFNIEKEITKSLTMKLTNTNFLSEWASYQDLNISSVGESTISVKGDDRGEKKEYSIQHLTLNTSDKATVNFEKIKIQKATGTLSDQTLVQMPAVNLKQMLK